MSLGYITETQAGDLIESTVKANLSRGFIKRPTGFTQHCIDTGTIAFEVAQRILQAHPPLGRAINPFIVKTEGYMHDFSKIFEGDNYHEIGTAHLILTKGDTELGLVVGEPAEERKDALRRMASIPISDYAIYESLGKSGFPEKALYPEVKNFIERIAQLRKALSRSQEPLTIEELSLPFSLEQQIGLYADLTNVGGKRVNVEERMKEVMQRYSDLNGDYCNPTVAELTEIIKPRILVVSKTIENLMQ